jgi:hypothetical protein
MTTFKKGDRVRLIEYDTGGWAKESGLTIGEIYEIDMVHNSSVRVLMSGFKSFWIVSKCFAKITDEQLFLPGIKKVLDK